MYTGALVGQDAVARVPHLICNCHAACCLGSFCLLRSLGTVLRGQQLLQAQQPPKASQSGPQYITWKTHACIEYTTWETYME